MRTGFNRVVTKIEDDKTIAIFVTLLERCVQCAEIYAIESGRTEVTNTDMKYALRYQCRHILEDDELVEHIESNRLLMDMTSSDGSIGSESLAANDEPFRRVSESCTNALALKMNRANDSWDQWVPETPLSVLLKGLADRVLSEE